MAGSKLTPMEIAERLLTFVEPEGEDSVMDAFLARAKSEEQELRFQREMHFMRIFTIESAVLSVLGRGEVAGEIIHSLKMLVQALVMQDIDVRTEAQRRNENYMAAACNRESKEGFQIAFKFAGFCVDDETDQGVASFGSVEFTRLFSAIPPFLEQCRKSGIEMPEL